MHYIDVNSYNAIVVYDSILSCLYNSMYIRSTLKMLVLASSSIDACKIQHDIDLRTNDEVWLFHICNL